MNTEEKRSIKRFNPQLIQEWENSGKTKSEFCKEHKITASLFYYWQKKIKNNQSSGFIPVNIVETNQLDTQRIEIRYPNGIYVLLPVNIEVSFLKSLIRKG